MKRKDSIESPRDARRRNMVLYTQALVEARANYPDDECAQHRFAMRVVKRVRANADSAPGDDLDLLQKTVTRALFDSYDKDADSEGRGPLSVVKTYPRFVIASARDGKLYQIDYTVGDAGIIFGNPMETEGKHVPIAS